MNKARWLLVLTLCFAPLLAGAQESAPTSVAPGAGTLSVGFHLVDRSGSFGLGGEVTSRYFLWERVAVRVRGELLWDRVDWNLFYAAKAGLLGVAGHIGDGIRLYGEGGVLLAFPTSELSTQDIVFGGYGHFGFEFLVQPFNRSCVSYLIELGSSGLSLRADQLAGSPYLLSGFAVTTGLRYYF